MKDGFVSTAICSPELRVANVEYNAEKIISKINEFGEKGVALAVFPELCITGYTCADLFLQRTLIDEALNALAACVEATKGVKTLVFIGAPLRLCGKLYDCAVAVSNGRILGIVPKTCISKSSGIDETRVFAVAKRDLELVNVLGADVPFGTDIIFEARNMPEFSVAAEIGNDLLAVDPVSSRHAAAGAGIIVNLGAYSEIVGRSEYLKKLAEGQSARLVCGYACANAGVGESTTDGVYSGYGLICEDGNTVAESKPFELCDKTAVIDVFYIADERAKNGSYPERYDEGYERVAFDADLEGCATPVVSRFPFIPETDGDSRAENILNIQAYALKRRLEHTHSKCAVIGVSGGLDSTLAILVAARAMKLSGRDVSDILAVTMPCFGTTGRTKNNAVMLSEKLGARVRTVNIADSVNRHFADIGHDPDNHNVTYENSQARERTQVLMDIANMEGGIVIGTGDLSELALGWATYNGDHMSMYGVNASVPKTLIRFLVKHIADDLGGDVKDILYDILDTPVSPELLPADSGKISQVTEDIVGPYELHDFFIYYAVRRGYSPERIFRLACAAFEGVYDRELIKKWLLNFYRRFFMQQFKRSCLPDGPKVGTVSFSPRGDLSMPSDADSKAFLDRVNAL